MTGSVVMTMFVYKELTKNPEIVISPSKLCPTSGDWSNLLITNLAHIPFIINLLNAAKSRLDRLPILSFGSY